VKGLDPGIEELSPRWSGALGEDGVMPVANPGDKSPADGIDVS
jgi:hypothetical protein